MLFWGVLVDMDAKDLTLAKDGKSDYVIVMPEKPTPPEQRAANELQSFFFQATGAKLPIQPDSAARPKRAIALGNPQCNRLTTAIPLSVIGEDGFVIRTDGDTVILGAGRGRGILNAVYSFLDRELGCRWYSTTVSKIPKRPTVTIGRRNITEFPAFEYREPYYTEAWDKDWASRNRCNGSAMKLDETTGGKIGYYPFVHTFYQILPPAQYFNDHPEYYSEINGKRTVDNAQLCLTNPDVLRLTIEKVKQWIKEHPEARIFSVSQNDCFNCCQCANCKKVIEEEGAPSGITLRFVNDVADAIGKEYPNVLIDTLAYQWTEAPPKLVKPHRNVRVRMAPIDNCFGHPVDRCEANAKPYANLLAWSKITNNLYIWSYCTNFGNYLAPFPDFDELGGSTLVYDKLGVKGVFYEGAYPAGGGAEFADLRSWVLAKLLWDPTQDVWMLIKDFVDGYYGAASEPMMQYLHLLHDVVKKDNIHFRIYDNPATVGYLRRDIVDQSEKLFEQMEAQAASDAAVLDRVQKARLSIDYTRLVQATGAAEKAKYAKIVADKIKHYGITEIREGQPVSQFLASIGQ